MTQTIHKHLLDWSQNYDTRVYVQPYARLIHVDRDTREPDKIALWFIVNDQLPAEDERLFYIIGTGWEIPNASMMQHVGSVRMEPFMWHVMELKP